MSKYDDNFILTNFNDSLSLNKSNIGLANQTTNTINNDRHLINNRTYQSNDAYVNQVVPDIINPIRKTVVKQVLSVDSLFRDNVDTTNSSNFNFTMQEPFKNVIAMKLCSLEIPNIWYSFSSERKSNTFKVIMKNMNDGSGFFYNQTYNVVVPDGNYTIYEFVIVMNNMFRNTDPNRGLDFLNISIDNITGRLVIRANDINDADIGSSPAPYDTTSSYYSPNLTYSLDFRIDDEPNRPLELNAGWMMGFQLPYYTVTNLDTFDDIISYPDKSVLYYNYLMSESIFGSGINTYLFLSIEDFNNNKRNLHYSGKDQYYIHNNIIARIPITSGSNTLVFNNATDLLFKTREYFGPVTIEKLNIKVLDKYGKIVSLNNNNFSFSLEFIQIYS